MYNRIYFALATLLLAVPAFAEVPNNTVAQAASNSAASGGLGLIGIGIGLTMGLAVLGGTFGQGKAASAALEGIARNPAVSGKLLVPLILSLALIESLVLFAFLIGFSLQGAIGTVLQNVFNYK